MAKDYSVLLPVGGAAGTGLIGWMIGGLTQFKLNFDSLAKDHSSFGLTILFLLVGILLMVAWQIILFVRDRPGPPVKLDYVMPAVAALCVIGSFVGYANSIRAEDKIVVHTDKGYYSVRVMRYDPSDPLGLRLALLPGNEKEVLVSSSESGPFKLRDGDRLLVSIKNLEDVSQEVSTLAQCANSAGDGAAPAPISPLCKDAAKRFIKPS